MGIWYYGIIAEDRDRVYVVYVGKNLAIGDDYELDMIGETLSELYEYVEEEGWRVRESDVATSPDVMEVLLHVYKLLERLFEYNPRLIAYVWLMRMMGKTPIIVSEYALEDYDKEVVYLDEVARDEGE